MESHCHMLHFFPYLAVVKISHCWHLFEQTLHVWVVVQDSNVADLTGDSTPILKKPRQEWSQWMKDVLQMQDEHLPHWVIARYADSSPGLCFCSHKWVVAANACARLSIIPRLLVGAIRCR